MKRINWIVSTKYPFSVLWSNFYGRLFVYKHWKLLVAFIILNLNQHRRYFRENCVPNYHYTFCQASRMLKYLVLISTRTKLSCWNVEINLQSHTFGVNIRNCNLKLIALLDEEWELGVPVLQFFVHITRRMCLHVFGCASNNHVRFFSDSVKISVIVAN